MNTKARSSKELKKCVDVKEDSHLKHYTPNMMKIQAANGLSINKTRDSEHFLPPTIEGDMDGASQLFSREGSVFSTGTSAGSVSIDDMLMSLSPELAPSKMSVEPEAMNHLESFFRDQCGREIQSEGAVTQKPRPEIRKQSRSLNSGVNIDLSVLDDEGDMDQFVQNMSDGEILRLLEDLKSNDEPTPEHRDPSVAAEKSMHPSSTSTNGFHRSQMQDETGCKNWTELYHEALRNGERPMAIPMENTGCGAGVGETVEWKQLYDAEMNMRTLHLEMAKLTAAGKPDWPSMSKSMPNMKNTMMRGVHSGSTNAHNPRAFRLGGHHASNMPILEPGVHNKPNFSGLARSENQFKTFRQPQLSAAELKLVENQRRRNNMPSGVKEERRSSPLMFELSESEKRFQDMVIERRFQEMSDVEFMNKAPKFGSSISEPRFNNRRNVPNQKQKESRFAPKFGLSSSVKTGRFERF